MLIKIENNFELVKAQEMVDLLGTKDVDKLDLGEFVLFENTLTKFVPNLEIATPSELVLEIRKMAKLIQEDNDATKNAIENKDWDLCLPKELSDKAQVYGRIFSDKYSVFNPDVLNTIWLETLKEVD